MKRPWLSSVNSLLCHVPTCHQVKIQGQNEEMLANACQQFMNMPEAQIRSIATETLEGHQRAIMGNMTVEVHWMHTLGPGDGCRVFCVIKWLLLMLVGLGVSVYYFYVSSEGVYYQSDSFLWLQSKVIFALSVTCYWRCQNEVPSTEASVCCHTKSHTLLHLCFQHCPSLCTIKYCRWSVFLPISVAFIISLLCSLWTCP